MSSTFEMSHSHRVAEGQPTQLGKLPSGASGAGSESQQGRFWTRKKVREAVLYKLLQQLSPKERKCMVQEHFTQEQRLALERWILGQDEGDTRAWFCEDGEGG